MNPVILKYAALGLLGKNGTLLDALALLIVNEKAELEQDCPRMDVLVAMGAPEKHLSLHHAQLADAGVSQRNRGFRSEQAVLRMKSQYRLVTELNMEI